MCKYKKVYRVLNYIGHLLIVISTITGWVFISAFASLVSIPIWIISSATGLKICAITAGINQQSISKQSIIKKKKKNHDKIVLLAKYK